MSPSVIKYLIAVLLASFLFACAAEAQNVKHLCPVTKISGK